MGVTLQKIFRGGFKAYSHKTGLSIDQHKAAHAIMDCQSESLGYETYQCLDDENHLEKINHSCKHRSCPRCNHGLINDWLEKTKSRLLDCNHFHVVFTLPHELHPIWHYNRKWCADRLHKASAETLQQLLKDKCYLGAEVGILSSLHTWGRTQSFHPHTHILITGGGLNGGNWLSVKRDFLLPVGVIKAKFRGKWLCWLNEAYDTGELNLPPDMALDDWKKILRTMAKKAWNIRIQGGYEHGKGVATYLSRYVKGGPIKNHALLDATAESVTFEYLDYRDERMKEMRLSVDNFISRVLWHVPVKGQHNIRYYGLYVANAVEKRKKVSELLKTTKEKPYKREMKERLCQSCGSALIRIGSTYRKISYILESTVQQAVQPDPSSSVVKDNLHSGYTPGGVFLSEQGLVN